MVVALQLRLREESRARMYEQGIPLVALWVAHLNAQGGKRPLEGVKPSAPLEPHEQYGLLEGIQQTMPWILPRDAGEPQASTIAGMPPAAARGVLDAIRRGLITAEALSNIAPQFKNLKATARGG